MRYRWKRMLVTVNNICIKKKKKSWKKDPVVKRRSEKAKGINFPESNLMVLGLWGEL